MPKVGKNAKTSGSKSQDSFNVRKRPAQPTLSKALGEKDAKVPRTSLGTELRLRKSDDAASVPKVAEPIARGPDPNKEAHLRILKQFDLTYHFGPCAGISRIERWFRAEKLNKCPPLEVKQLLDGHTDDVDYVQSLWYDRSM